MPVLIYPPQGGVADEEVAVKTLLIVPGDTLVFLLPLGIRLIAPVGPLQTVVREKATPVVVCPAAGPRPAGGVLDDDTLVKPARHVARGEVHLADVDAEIAAVGQVLHPVAMLGPGIEAVRPGGVGVHPGEDGGARGHASGARTEGLPEGGTCRRQAVHGGGGHVIVAPGSDGVEALLVGHDEDDVRLLGHAFPYLAVNTDGYGNSEKLRLIKALGELAVAGCGRCFRRL